MGNGMTLTDVIGKRTLRQLIDRFVDDTSLFTNLLKTFIDLNDIELLTSRLQHDMITWKELLEASGGKLELTKCFYYILAWRFDHKGNPIPTYIAEQREKAPQIRVPDTSTTNTIYITQKEITEAHKTLGCFRCIICNELAEIEYLKARSNTFASKIKNYGLTHRLNMVCHQHLYLINK